MLFGALITAIPPAVAAPVAFAAAAVLNYLLCILILFRRRERSARWIEIGTYVAVVVGAGAVDLVATLGLMRADVIPWVAKSVASIIALGFNFVGRRLLVFPARQPGPWAPADPRYRPTSEPQGDEDVQSSQPLASRPTAS